MKESKIKHVYRELFKCLHPQLLKHAVLRFESDIPVGKQYYFQFHYVLADCPTKPSVP